MDNYQWVIEVEGQIVAEFFHEEDRDESLATGDWPDNAEPAFINY